MNLPSVLASYGQQRLNQRYSFRIIARSSEHVTARRIAQSCQKMRFGLLLKLSLCGLLLALAISSIHLWLKEKNYIFSEDVISKLGRDAFKKHGTTKYTRGLPQYTCCRSLCECIVNASVLSNGLLFHCSRSLPHILLFPSPPLPYEQATVTLWTLVVLSSVCCSACAQSTSVSLLQGRTTKLPSATLRSN